MRDLLYLCHRIPFPPNKGDKIRSYNELAYLARHFRVHLGTFIDDEEDIQYKAALEKICASTFFARIDPRWRKIRSLTGLFSGKALTLPFYTHHDLKKWVRNTHRQHDIAVQFAFSSAMVPFMRLPFEGTSIIDFVDVDSDKWRQYAANKSWPMAWIYRREGKKLAQAERDFAARANLSLVVTEPEAALLREVTGQNQERAIAVGNGVDYDFFSPDHAFASVFPSGIKPLVFTGAMDYWPNVEGGLWFVENVLPLIREAHPEVVLYCVGSKPDAKLTAAAAISDGAVAVTGRVEDVRPYILGATVSVAPLRIARGIQNKVLEAMACAKAVVATPEAFEGIDATPGKDLYVSEKADELAKAIIRLIENPAERAAMGTCARAVIEGKYSWPAQLKRLNPALKLV